MKKTFIAENTLQLNESVLAFLQGFSKMQASMNHLSIPEQRQKIKSLFLFPKDQLEPVEVIEEREITGRHGKIPIRIITPQHVKTKAAVIFFHRGGWVYGSNDESENLCRKIANHAGCLIVQVEYRLAPEHPFPIPLDDCYDALKWAATYFVNEARPLVVCGESAGGNLAAAVSLMAQKEKGPKIAGQVLIYPILTNTLVSERYERSPDKHLLSYANMQWFWKQYLAQPEQGDNPLASPLKGENFQGQPKTLVMAAEYDALCEEAWEYAEKLKKAGVEVIYKQYAHVIHGFLDLPLESPEIQRALDDLRDFLP